MTGGTLALSFRAEREIFVIRRQTVDGRKPKWETCFPQTFGHRLSLYCGETASTISHSAFGRNFRTPHVLPLITIKSVFPKSENRTLLIAGCGFLILILLPLPHHLQKSAAQLYS